MWLQFYCPLLYVSMGTDGTAAAHLRGCHFHNYACLRSFVSSCDLPTAHESLVHQQFTYNLHERLGTIILCYPAPRVAVAELRVASYWAHLPQRCSARVPYPQSHAMTQLSPPYIRLFACQVLVDFSATWCGPCQMIGPYFGQLSTEFPNLVFLKIDVDACEVCGSLRKLGGPTACRAVLFGCMNTMLVTAIGRRSASKYASAACVRDVACQSFTV